MTESDLMRKAREARKKSYSPYSNFAVGAAVEMESGRVFTGTNIENCSYGLTICAERVAIFNAISNGEVNIKRLAISCKSSENFSELMPCGACRQVISEFSTPETEIIVDGVDTFKLDQLLPNAFKITP